MARTRDLKSVWTYEGTTLVNTELPEHPTRTPERAAAFCAALAETASITRACRAIGIGRSTAYDWKDADEAFSIAWERALQIGVGGLTDEAVRRGYEGVDEPLTHMGHFTYEMEPALDPDGMPILNAVGEVVMVPIKGPNGLPIRATIKRYSDPLLTTLLKAHDPRYRDKVDVNHGLSESLADMLREARERTR